MGKVVVPNDYVEGFNETPIFLAGPIKGAPNWHDDAIKYLFSQKDDLIIFSPNTKLNEESSSYLFFGRKSYFPRQRAWERHYLELASKTGSVLFWLPGEEKHDCDQVYGAMTRLELGEFLGWYKFNKKVSFCVGTDGEFPEMKTLLFDLNLDSPNKTIFSTLEEACKGVVDSVKTVSCNVNFPWGM